MFKQEKNSSIFGEMFKLGSGWTDSVLSFMPAVLDQRMNETRSSWGAFEGET